jgi:hypothetical protein
VARVPPKADRIDQLGEWHSLYSPKRRSRRLVPRKDFISVKYCSGLVDSRIPDYSKTSELFQLSGVLTTANSLNEFRCNESRQTSRDHFDSCSNVWIFVSRIGSYCRLLCFSCVLQNTKLRFYWRKQDLYYIWDKVQRIERLEIKLNLRRFLLYNPPCTTWWLCVVLSRITISELQGSGPRRTVRA